MPPTPPQEQMFGRKLASHTLAAALGAAVGSLLSFYHGQRSYAQEECVRRGMEVRFERDFPQYKDRLPTDNGLNYISTGELRASYTTGHVIAPANITRSESFQLLLQQAAKRGQEAERTLERECAENPQRY